MCFEADARVDDSLRPMEPILMITAGRLAKKVEDMAMQSDLTVLKEYEESNGSDY